MLIINKKRKETMVNYKYELSFEGEEESSNKMIG